MRRLRAGADMLEAILQILGELLLQLFAETLAELGFHAVREPFRRRPHPVVAVIGMLLLGGLAGGLSLLVMPGHLAHTQTQRLASLVLVPVLAGGAMMLFGYWRQRRGDAPLRIDRFAYGYVFALAMALVRYYLAH